MLSSLRRHWIAVLMLGMSACPLSAQSDPGNGTTTTDPVTGAILNIGGGASFWNAINPDLFTTRVVQGNLPTVPLSVSPPSVVLTPTTTSGTLLLSGSNTGTTTTTGTTTILSGPLLESGGSTTLSSVNGLTITGSTLGRTSLLSGSLTANGSQTTTTTGTVSLTNSTNVITGTSGLILLGASTGTTSTGTVTLTGSQVLTSSGSTTLTLAGTSSNLTLSQGTASFTNTVNVSGDLNLLSSGTLRVQFTGSGSSATTHVLNVAGAITLSGALTVVPPADLPVGGTFVILNKTSPGAVTGIFAGSPHGSIVRASGREFIIRYTGGDGNDVTLTAVSKLQAWRQAHFGTISNIGAAADDADADGDGIPNLIERACSLDPTTGSVLPVTTVHTGTALEYSYVRSVASVQAGDVFTVEWNDSLASTGWSSVSVIQQVLTDDGTVQSVKAFVPAGDSGQRFIRLRVNAAP